MRQRGGHCRETDTPFRPGRRFSAGIDLGHRFCGGGNHLSHQEMPVPNTLATILSALSDGTAVPYLGAGALAGVTDPASGRAIPADSDSLILAMNGGQP